MRKEKVIFDGTCYVLLRTNKIHPIAYDRHHLIWYPEIYMTLLECVQYQPYVKSIVTENSWLIACYDYEDVRIWSTEYVKKGSWIIPNDQTYGASVDSIMRRILGIKQTIPAIALDGGESIKKFIKELEIKKVA